MRFIFSLSLVFIFCNNINGQYVFEHMNGRLLKVFNYNDSAFVDIKYSFDKNSLKNERIAYKNENLRFEILEKKGDNLSRAELDSMVALKSKPFKPAKIKESFINPSDLFAIHLPDGTRKVLYFYDEGFGNYYSVDEMQDFIYGERDALMKYRGRAAFWGGMGFGAVTGFALQGSVFSVVTPFVWTLGATFPVIRIKEKYMSDPMRKTQPYKSGFARTARTRNMIQGLKGSVIGLGIGILSYSIAAANSTAIK
jgi:hypothetical protein